MTLTLHLSPELEQRLKQEARRQEIALDAYAVQLLAQSLPPTDRQTALVTLLQSWIDKLPGDGASQHDLYIYVGH